MALLPLSRFRILIKGKRLPEFHIEHVGQFLTVDFLDDTDPAVVGVLVEEKHLQTGSLA